MMTDTQAMLIAQEGWALRPYTDSVGKITIGCGRNLSDQGISSDEALMLLNKDIGTAVEDAMALCTVYTQLSRPRQLVLIGLAFNLGRERFGKFVRFIDALQRGNYDDAADELRNSKWFHQVGLRGTTYEKMMREDISEWI